MAIRDTAVIVRENRELEDQVCLDYLEAVFIGHNIVSTVIQYKVLGKRSC